MSAAVLCRPVLKLTHRHTFTQALHTPRRVPHGGGLRGRHAHGELEAHGGCGERYGSRVCVCGRLCVYVANVERRAAPCTGLVRVPAPPGVFEPVPSTVPVPVRRQFSDRFFLPLLHSRPADHLCNLGTDPLFQPVAPAARASRLTLELLTKHSGVQDVELVRRARTQTFGQRIES